ncbi:MAG: protein kinase [Thermogemmatispora sp.]|uniref:FHA domain-containing serine/threonine-protein kinase n=1 Tax=Thermogemmatispora sp. TaxID=1968838 RepID=UPI00260D6CE7|nr:FHA domain-containing serine/threonine-protein kinase [Thermogemmatispora sp.]MBX5457201.1 protein kinase [Thermogemmatispora sp.]
MNEEYIGRTVGQYRIEAVLGAGGMGQVFRGVHQLLERPAAIKVMLPSFAARPDFRARFLQEAKAVAALHHPNIVEVYDYGDENGLLYMVMEYMEDGALSNLLKRQSGKRLPLPQVLMLGIQVAQGLAAAHALQMVHRDIKPANLLLRRLAGSEPGREHYLVKISDFGLARLVEGGVETVTGTPMGTLAYMSPEQCLGTKTIDGRSDLYALGVVLYEMLTGSLPFQISGVADAIYKHVNVMPPRPRELRPELPSILEEIVMCCLAKKPEERFANGQALANALQNVLGGSGEGAAVPVSTSGPGLQQASLQTRTTLDAPASPTALPAPPTVSTMPGYSDVPRVRVIDESGRTLQIVEVRPAGIIVGRQEGSDIVLLSKQVSRQHLRITWDGKEVRLLDLGSSNGTLLEGVRLMPQVSQVWQERQMVRLGPFWLRLEGSSPPATVVRSNVGPASPPGAARPGGMGSSTYANYAAPTVANSQGPTSLASERIGLAVSPKTLTLVPGQTATVQLTLTNMGSIVDWFTPTVEGVPAEWLHGAGQEVQLNPGMQETVTLTINVARRPSHRAGQYHVLIRARSREQPQEYSQTNCVWTVQPFSEETLRLEPRRASGRGRASYTLAVANAGNAAARYQLEGEDDEQRLRYLFRVNPLELDSGREARIGLSVQERRRLIGREERIPFQVHLKALGERRSQSAAGEFVNKALLPPWIVPALLAVVLIAGGALALARGLVPLPGKPGTAVSTPAPNVAATLTALVQTGASTATVAAVSSQATATAQANATAAAQNSSQATAMAQANATATAQANATATALANPPPPQAQTVTTLVSGLAAPIGSQYVSAGDRLFFVEYGGKVSLLANVSGSSPTYSVLGAGYSLLEDVAVTSDGQTLYLTERQGNLYRVTLAVGANRSQATVVASGLAAPQQIALDGNVAYVALYNDSGPLGSVVKVDLSSGTVTTVLSNLQHPIGVLMASDHHTLYVTEQQPDGSGTLSRFDLATGTRTQLAHSQGAPFFFLHWANSLQTAILVPERSPTNEIWYISLVDDPSVLHPVAHVGAAPSDVVTAGQQPGNFFPMFVCAAASNAIQRLS